MDDLIVFRVRGSFFDFLNADVHDYQQIIDPAEIAPKMNMVGIKGDFQPFIVSFQPCRCRLVIRSVNRSVYSLVAIQEITLTRRILCLGIRYKGLEPSGDQQPGMAAVVHA